MPRTRSNRPGAFTIVELLVVIGMIAVIAALLIPSVNKFREQANQAVCGSNLRQIGVAFLSYARDNGDKFPFHADWGPANKEDWIHWQPGTGRDNADLTRTSAIAKGMGQFEARVFRCPSDNPDLRTRFDTSRQGPRRYEFSYSMNGRFASNWNPAGPRITATPNPSGKMLVLEEDELSLDDGHYWPDGYGGPLENFLGTRHNRPRLRDWRRWQSFPQAQRPDRMERGNVAFADGHVEFVPRSLTWDDAAYNPWRH
ncbi:MAG TPA: H-X9-DG-CTERM domain-containing protein [Tepidisphaeraceae bacterium]|nr:H-X9-DG-CTERM domain-containing protein [Tepidisphaeraceae bacterium]